MKLQIVEISKIKKAKYNSPVRTEEKFIKGLMNSIDEVGIIVPVILDKDFNLIDGHRRVASAEKLGWKEVPAVIHEKADTEFKDNVYEEVNTNARKLNEADQLYTYLHGGKISRKVETAIGKIKGVAGEKILNLMLERRISPTHTWNIFNRLSKYTTLQSPKAALEWIAAHETAYRIRRAIADGVSGTVINNAIKKDKPLKQKWMA